MIDLNDKITFAVLQVLADAKGKAIRYNQLSRETIEIIGRNISSKNFAAIIKSFVTDGILNRDEKNPYRVEYGLTMEGYTTLSEQFEVFSRETNQHLRNLASIIQRLGNQ